MKVKELIGYLQRKNPEADVQFIAEEAITNRNYTVMYKRGEKMWEEDPASITFNVDDICSKADGKIVYLSESWRDEDENESARTIDGYDLV